MSLDDNCPKDISYHLGTVLVAKSRPFRAFQHSSSALTRRSRCHAAADGRVMDQGIYWIAFSSNIKSMEFSIGRAFPELFAQKKKVITALPLFSRRLQLANLPQVAQQVPLGIPYMTHPRRNDRSDRNGSDRVQAGGASVGLRTG